MSEEVGEASVRIVADTTGFIADVSRVTNAQSRIITAAARQQSAAVQAASREATARIRADAQTQAAAARASAAEATAAYRSAAVQATAASREATARIRADAPLQAAAARAAATESVAAQRAAAAESAAAHRVATARIIADIRAQEAAVRVATATQLAQIRSSSRAGAGDIGALSGAFGGLKSQLQNLPTAGLQAFIQVAERATQVVLGFGLALGTVGIKAASELADTRLAIGSLGDQLKDISAADLVEDLRDLSAQSGVALGAIARAEQGFVSLGVSGKDALSVINATLSGLAASGNLSAASLSGVARALQQIGSKPFLQLEELNQISDQIPAASRVKIIRQLAKDTGDSIAEIQERFRLGTQQAGDALTAVVKVIDGLDRSGQALENRTKTIGGAFAKAKAEINNALADVFTPLGEQLAAELNRIDVAGLSEKVGQPIADAFAQLAPTAIQALPALVQGLAFSFELLTPLIVNAAESIAAVAQGIVDHEEQIRGFASDVGDFAAGLVSLFEAIEPPLLLALSSLDPFLDILSSIGDILQFLEPLFEALGVTAEISFLPVRLSLDAISIALNLITGDIDGVANSLSSLGNVAVSVYNQIADIVPLMGRLGSSEIGGQAGAKGGGTFSSVLGGAGGDDMGAVASQAALAKLSAARKTPTFANTGVGGGSAAASKAASEAKKRADAIIRATEAAMKVARDIAKKTSEQSVEQIENAFEKLYEDLRDAGQKSFIKGAKDIEARLLQVARRRDRTIDQLKEATDRLTDLKQEALSFNDSIRSSILELGNVAEPTRGIAQTFLGIQNNLRGAIASATQFKAVIAQLTAAGLNQDSLRQIVEAGPEAGVTAGRALLTGGAAGIAEINRLQATLKSEAVTISDSITDTFYKAGISAAQGLVTGLQSQEAAIEAQMNRIGDKLVKQLKRALKINSPSLVLADEVGKPAGMGIVKGLVSSLDGAMGSAGSRSVRNYAQNINIGPITANGATEAGAARMGGGIGMGIEDILLRMNTQSVLNGMG